MELCSGSDLVENGLRQPSSARQLVFGTIRAYRLQKYVIKNTRQCLDRIGYDLHCAFVQTLSPGRVVAGLFWAALGES